jgi:hypothetical protein
MQKHQHQRAQAREHQDFRLGAIGFIRRAGHAATGRKRRGLGQRAKQLYASGTQARLLWASDGIVTSHACSICF